MKEDPACGNKSGYNLLKGEFYSKTETGINIFEGRQESLVLQKEALERGLHTSFS
jgi:hypothetical protein